MSDHEVGRRNGNRNGDGAACRLDIDEQLAALESAHEFPGLFPVVVIARTEDTFRDRLARLVEELPTEGAVMIREQPSRGGRYVSYRLQLHVDTARSALACRDRLAELDGVILIL